MQRFRGGVIGLDVDSGAIKAVQLGHTSEGYVLQHVGYHRLPEGAVRDGEVADGEALAAEIRKFWSLHSFRGKNVILGVSGSNVVVRFVDFPRLSTEDLDGALRFQAEEHIPMPISDVVLDHVVLGPAEENPEEDRVLLVAAHREMIGDYISAFRSGSLRPAGIDVKALSLTRSALPEALFDEEETVLLLDIGTELSNLVVVQGSRPTLTQFLPLGFQDFTKAVAEAADIEMDLAEKQALNPLASLATINEAETSEDRTRQLDTTSEDETLRLPRPRKDPDPTPPNSEPQEDERQPEGEMSPGGDGGTADTPGVSGDAGGDAERADSGTSGASPDEAGTEELSSDPALIFDVRRGLEGVAAKLVEDVRRAIDYHDSRPRAREVTRLLISGEGALIRGLDEYLGDRIGIRAEMSRPTSKLVANKSNISDEQLAAMEPVLAIALGLAMDEA